ncbi:biogenesis of lysosome-related organelles complex 1 subunit 6 [Periplaneta americana]|uniref:biogenesis of lysosome-related organelles complex 1 subunit 6 n=1 Tax=Periplaneta americana TaxID=6978 RepID=UPI0037E9C607
MTDLTKQTTAVVPQETSNVSVADVEKLAAGLLALYQPELKKVKHQLDELTKKQGGLVEQLEQENSRFNAAHTSEDLQEMFAMVKLYQTKLVAIKKDMSQLHDKATKLKKRALKLQQTKQRAALQREQQRELQLQRETDLIAKPPGKSS